MPHSIRQRLLIFIFTLTFVSWSAIAYMNYSDARHEIEELFDAHLIQSAKVLLSLVDMELYEKEHATGREMEELLALKDVEAHLYRHKYEKLLAFQIAVKEKNFIFSSASAPGQPLSDTTKGFSNNLINNTHWRVYTLQDPLNIITIRVAEPFSVRASLVNEIAFNLLTPLLLGLPVIFILIWKSVDIIFKPLNAITSDLRKRNPLQLDPVIHNKVPTEIQPLIDSLNYLFFRLDNILQNERRFTSDAAHELRTPLAGLKTQAQIALRTQDTEKREHALNNILKSVDRTNHLVEQLLTLARLEPGLEHMHFEDCNLNRLIQGIVTDLMPFAVEKEITVKFNNPGPLYLSVNKQALSMLVRNLLDNAIRYTGPRNSVNVTLEENKSGVILRIADSGPGIPAELRKDVLKRFFRANQTSETGSGLGLSIVKQIADLHHAELHLGESEANGLQVEIIFPRKYPERQQG